MIHGNLIERPLVPFSCGMTALLDLLYRWADAGFPDIRMTPTWPVLFDVWNFQNE